MRSTHQIDDTDVLATGSKHDQPTVNRSSVAALFLVLAMGASCETTQATRNEFDVTLARAAELQDETGRLITICMDGTWNVPTDDTNVWQFHEIAKAGSRDGKVIAYYTEGVGTTLATKKAGGKLGHGIDSRVSKTYAFLCRTWKPGDHVVLVGFSRGAYQARLLAGVIDMFGIYHEEPATPGKPRRRIDAEAWCQRYYDLTTGSGRVRVPREMTERYEPPGEWVEASIDCLVCFDTVAAVAPIDEIISATLQRYPPPPAAFTRLFPSVELALHALALDEDRKAFRVVPFSGNPSPDRLKQVWFAGAHSDIGGGYEQHGQNQIVLDWVLQELPAHVRDLLGSPGTPLPKLHREDGSVWVREKRSSVAGSTIHSSVMERLRGADYQPEAEWWSRTASGDDGEGDGTLGTALSDTVEPTFD